MSFAKPLMWINHPKQNERVWLYYVPDDVWPRKFKQFTQKILELEGTISIRRAARAGGAARKTAAKYLDILEKNNLLMSATIGLPSRKVYLVSEGSFLERLENLIRNQPGYLEERYRYLSELMHKSLVEILPDLDVWLEESQRPPFMRHK